jgi:hypothetical protein
MKNRYVAAGLMLLIGAPVAVGLGIAGCEGKGAEGACGPQANICGGTLTGFWDVTGYCQYAPVQPSQPLTAVEYTSKPQSPMVAPPQPLPSTSGDWCSDLFYPGPGQLGDVLLFHDAPVVGPGSTVQFSSNNTYDAELVLQAPGTTSFSLACLQAGGFAPTCTQLQNDLTTFLAAQAGQKVLNIACSSSDDGGCSCSYIFELKVSDQGTWTAAGTTVYQSSVQYAYNGSGGGEAVVFQPQKPVPSDYCVQDGTLQMTGQDGNSLSGVQGLRSLTLTPSKTPPPSGDGGTN